MCVCVNIVDLSQIALERATTAKEAVLLLGNLSETFGYNDRAESLFVSDPHEVWLWHVLVGDQARGSLWAAQRLAENRLGLSRMPSPSAPLGLSVCSARSAKQRSVQSSGTDRCPLTSREFLRRGRVHSTQLVDGGACVKQLVTRITGCGAYWPRCAVPDGRGRPTCECSAWGRVCRNARLLRRDAIRAQRWNGSWSFRNA